LRRNPSGRLDRASEEEEEEEVPARAPAMDRASAMDRLQRVLEHVHGRQADGVPLWARLADAGHDPRPKPPEGQCRCSADKWRYVCRCFACLEHWGRAHEFEWTPDLVRPRHLSPRAVAGGPAPPAGRKKFDDIALEEVSGSTRLTSADGRIIGPQSPSVHPRYSGISTFARLPQLHELLANQSSSSGLLHVRVLGGHSLRDRDTGILGDVSDPYVVVRVGTVEHRTPTIKNDLNPVWTGDNEFSFTLGGQDGVLELEVRNANLLIPDNSLGRTSVGLWTLPSGRWQQRREKLVDGQGGELEVDLCLERRSAGTVDIAVLGVPFDSGCSFRPGARFGAESIRANSRLIRPYMIAAQQRPLLERQVVDAGDVACTPFGILQAMDSIFQGCREKLQVARRLVVMGGDHTLSYPVMKAVKERFGPVALIHFDSHLDTFPPMYEQDTWHGSPFRKCWEDGLLAKDGSTHIGIRGSTYAYQDLVDSDQMGIATLTAEDVHERGVQTCLEVVRGRYERAGGAGDRSVMDPQAKSGISKSRTCHQHTLSQVRADFWGRRWGASGALRAPGRGVPTADPRNPCGSQVYDYVIFLLAAGSDFIMSGLVCAGVAS
ncbi:unnamed protein product, partial [Prorocentrum cordatum]